jgi:hypothetical protein
MNALVSMAQLTDLYPSLAQVQPAPDAPESGLQPFELPANSVLFSENTPCAAWQAPSRLERPRARPGDLSHRTIARNERLIALFIIQPWSFHEIKRWRH